MSDNRARHPGYPAVLMHLWVTVKGKSMIQAGKIMTSLLSVAALVTVVVACEKRQETAEEGTAEKIGKQVDEAAAKAGKELNKAAEKAGQGLSRMGEKLQNAAKEAQQQEKE